MKNHSDTITLAIPSKKGFEKVAMSVGECIASQVGLTPRKAAHLKIALAEACTNAMEHGNRFQAELPVTVQFAMCPSRLEVTVSDVGAHEGHGLREEVFDIDAKVSGYGPRRGWGLFLIRNLVDEFSTEKLPGRGIRVKMVDYLQFGECQDTQ